MILLAKDFEAMWKSMIFCQIIRRSNVTVNSLIVSTLLRSNVHKLKPSRQKSFTFPCFFLLFLNANFFWRLGLNLVKLGYSEKASKLKKNLPHKLWRYSVKLSGRLFQILWPSQNIQTLPHNCRNPFRRRGRDGIIPTTSGKWQLPDNCLTN